MASFASAAPRSSAFKMRLIIAAVIALVTLASYFMASDVNPVTGENQRMTMSEEEAIAMVLNALRK